MDKNIPPGLVVIAPMSLFDDFVGSKKLNGAGVGNLWKAFFTSSKVSQNNTDVRLEYLFWRVWSSETLLNKLDVTLIDRLVMRIMESDIKVKTIKPVGLPSPRLMQSIKPFKVITQKEFIFPNPNGIPAQSLYNTARSGPCETQMPLHPILKKSKAIPIQGDVPKTTRLLLSKPDGECITLNPSNPPSPTLLTEHMPENSGKLGTKKTNLAVSRPTRGGRRRPVFNRRKSSQSSISKTPSSPSRPRFKLDDDFDDFDMPEVTHDENCAYETETDRQAKLDLEETWTEVDRPVQASIIPHAIISEKIVPQETELTDPMQTTVSLDPKEKSIQYTEESEDDSTTESCEMSDNSDLDEKVPGFPDVKRVRMSKAFLDEFACILTNPEPIRGYIPLPERPWYAHHHSWGPLPHDQYLMDSILLNEDAVSNPQPSQKRLVLPGFRQRFYDWMEEIKDYY